MLALAAGVGIYYVIEETKLFPPAATAFKSLVLAAASTYSVPWQLMAAEIAQESAWDPNAYNAASGATGIAQFEPATAAGLGIDPMDPNQAIPGMARYLSQLNTQLSAAGYSQWSYTLAAYDWGIGNVLNALENGVPPDEWPAETRDYVQRIAAASNIDTVTAQAFA